MSHFTRLRVYSYVKLESMAISYLHPGQVKPPLIAAMLHYESVLRSHYPRAQIIIHSDWNAPNTGGHVNESQHFLGLAADYHVENVKLWDAWMILERIPDVRGIGIYPFWNSPGLHADTRNTPERARWGRMKDGSYVDVTDAFGALVIG